MSGRMDYEGRELPLEMRYFGVLNLLCEVAPKLNNEERESIEMALADAAANHPGMTWRRIIHRFEIDFDSEVGS